MKRTICVTVAQESLDSIDDHAADIAVSRSTLVQAAIRHFLNTHLDANEGMKKMWWALYDVAHEGGDMEDACLHMAEAAEQYRAQFRSVPRDERWAGTV